MRTNYWIALVLFLVAALLSAWLSPALSQGGIKAAALPGDTNGRILLRGGETPKLEPTPAPVNGLEAETTAGLAVAVQEAIYLPLLEEDPEVYLPIVHR